MYKRWNNSRHGFTIVELLVVIVVMGILFSVGVSAYSGVQQKTRDTQRVSDMKTIVKALEMYKVQTGSYPAPSATNTISGWEVSSKNPSEFLSVLKTTKVISSVPVDPTNTDTIDENGFLYKYYRYNAGANSCPSARGAYYVLIAGKAETSTFQMEGSPGFQCGTKTWGGGYVTGAFTNG